MKSVVRKAGFPVVLTRSLGVEATSHQCGTARMGHDPAASVVDADLHAHDLDNLWIVDSSPFPVVGRRDPALTVAAWPCDSPTPAPSRRDPLARTPSSVHRYRVAPVALDEGHVMTTRLRQSRPSRRCSNPSRLARSRSAIG